MAAVVIAFSVALWLTKVTPQVQRMRELGNQTAAFPTCVDTEISLRNLWSRRYSSKAPSSSYCGMLSSFKIRMRLFEVFSRTVLRLRGSHPDRTNPVDRSHPAPPPESDDNRLFLHGQHCRSCLPGAGRKIGNRGPLLPFGDGLLVDPVAACSVLRPCCIARRIASVVVALP